MEQNYFEEFEEREAQKGMTVIACYPGKTAQVVEIDGSLKVAISSQSTFPATPWLLSVMKKVKLTVWN